MTSSNSNGPRLPRWLVECGLNTWDILRAARYGELRQENEKRIRRKIEDNEKLRNLMNQNLEKEMANALEAINIEQGLKEIIKKITEDQLEDIKNELNEEKDKIKTENKERMQKVIQEIEKSINEAKEEFKNSEKNIKENMTNLKENIKENIIKLEESITEAIRQQVYNIKAYKNMESELRKIQAGIILIPVFLVAFSVFFGDRIKDIMLIDVLQAEIKSLQEDVKSLRSTQGKGAYPHGLPPWEGGNCPHGGIFPDC